MAVKIRLARHGKKGAPFYHIVAADSRAPRDGRFIEKIGTYNPNTNPATINLEFDRALDWLQKGAQPTDTCRAILSYKGVMMKKHLLGGVAKGAFSAEDAEAKFAKWLAAKDEQIVAKSTKLSADSVKAQKARLAEEAKVREARIQAIEAKKAEAVAEEAPEQAEEPAVPAEETAEVAETPVQNETETPAEQEEKEEAFEAAGNIGEIDPDVAQEVAEEKAEQEA